MWLFLLLIVAFAPVSMAAGTSLDVLKFERKLKMEAWSEYLEDPTQTLRLSDIRGDYENKFIRSSDETLNKGYTKSAYWLHFQLSYSAEAVSSARHLLVQLDYALLDDIEFFVVSRDVAESYWHTGDLFPAQSRPVEHGTFVFPIAMEPGAVKDIYLRVRGSSSMRLPVVLWDELEFHKTQRSAALVHGLFYGILFLMAFYNLCLFITIRDTTYLFYIGYTMSVTVFQSIMIGDAPVYLWADTPQLNEHIMPVAIYLTAVFLILFSHRVLDIAYLSPRFSIYLKILGAFQGIGLVLAVFLPYGSTIQIASIASIFVSVSIIATGIMAAFKRHRSAKFFLFAWLTFLTGAVILAMVSLGLLPANAFTTNAFFFGNAIEATLLSLSLAERMRYTLQAKVTAEQRANEALVGANVSLQESNSLKDEFLATISHELRTPMNGVIGSIEQLKTPSDVETQQRLVSCADQSAHHLMGLLDSVLTYTELASKKLIIEQQSVNLVRVIDEVTATFVPVCNQKGLTLDVKYDPAIPAVLGDARRIQQILHSLLDNAVKFTARGNVMLAARMMPTRNDEPISLLFTVADTGIGIADNAKDVIFEKFRQADGAFSRGHGGLGIGLAICKELARSMGGNIEFESVQNEGSVFNLRLSLPVAPIQAAAIVVVPEANIHIIPRVLIVEDNPTNQLVLKGMLKKLGIEVLTANNGKEALDLVCAELIDGILMDCQMPVMDGFEATAEIRRMAAPLRDIPIIAVTANAMAQDKAQCLEVGMNDYMSKPVNAVLLKEKLAFWLARAPQPKALAA